MKTRVSSVSGGLSCTVPPSSCIWPPHFISAQHRLLLWFSEGILLWWHDLNKNQALSFTCCVFNHFHLGSLNVSRTLTTLPWLPTSGGKSLALLAQGASSLSLILRAQLRFISLFPVSLTENQIHEAGLGAEDIGRLKAKEYLPRCPSWCPSMLSLSHALDVFHLSAPERSCGFTLRELRFPPWAFPPSQTPCSSAIMFCCLLFFSSNIWTYVFYGDACGQQHLLLPASSYTLIWTVITPSAAICVLCLPTICSCQVFIFYKLPIMYW